MAPYGAVWHGAKISYGVWHMAWRSKKMSNTDQNAHNRLYTTIYHSEMYINKL